MNWIDTIESSCSWINIYYGVLSSYINEKNYNGFEGVRIAVHEFAIKNNLSLNRMINVKTGYLTHWFFIKDKFIVQNKPNLQLKTYKK
jgi:hypothetical protein